MLTLGKTKEEKLVRIVFKITESFREEFAGCMKERDTNQSAWLRRQAAQFIEETKEGRKKCL